MAVSPAYVNGGGNGGWLKRGRRNVCGNVEASSGVNGV